MTANVWKQRRMAAWSVGLVIAIAPAGVALGSGWATLRVLGHRSGGTAMVVAATAFAAFAAVAVHVVTTRALRGLVPLQALLAISVVFPDRAPSRVAAALRTNRAHRLARRLARGDGGEPVAGPGEPPDGLAAELLGVLAQLGRHDPRTRGHAERVRAYSETIARGLGFRPDDVVLLGWAALLHDIGKVGVPRCLLDKPGRLTPDEELVMRRHPELGDRLVAPLRDWLGPYADVPLRHHERWDGGGYPGGLAGPGIPLGARIVAVADAFDVMTSARAYKTPGPPLDARAELVAAAGTQFDPDVVRAFLLAGVEPIPGRRSAAASVAGALGALRWPWLAGESAGTAGSALGAAAIGTASLLGAAGMVIAPELAGRAAGDAPSRPLAGAVLAAHTGPGDPVQAGPELLGGGVISLLDALRDPLAIASPRPQAPADPPASPPSPSVARSGGSTVGASTATGSPAAARPATGAAELVAPVAQAAGTVVDGAAAAVAPALESAAAALDAAAVDVIGPVGAPAVAASTSVVAAATPVVGASTSVVAAATPVVGASTSAVTALPPAVDSPPAADALPAVDLAPPAAEVPAVDAAPTVPLVGSATSGLASAEPVLAGVSPALAVPLG